MDKKYFQDEFNTFGGKLAYIEKERKIFINCELTSEVLTDFETALFKLSETKKPIDDYLNCLGGDLNVA